jgi:hypothetical protein
MPDADPEPALEGRPHGQRDLSLSAGGLSHIGAQGHHPAQGASSAGQSIPLDDADIECLIQGLRLVAPGTQRVNRLIDLLEQIRSAGREGAGGPE